MRERDRQQVLPEDDAWLKDPEEPRVSSAGWRLPNGARLDGRYVCASAYLTANARRVFPDRTLLRRFVGLAGGSDDAIVRFVEQWGLMGLCRHGLSPAHTLGGTTRRRRCTLLIREGLAYEPLAAWREISGQARAILKISASLHDGGVGSPDDWKTIGFDNWRIGATYTNLSKVVNGWLDAGAVVPRLTWLDPVRPRRGIPRIILDGSSLAGGLGLMLLLAVARSEAVIPCSEPDCSALAVPARRGAKPYCAEHLGRGVRERDRAKDFRVKNPTYYSDRRSRLRNPVPANSDGQEAETGS
jgi:hypothetical protein